MSSSAAGRKCGKSKITKGNDETDAYGAKSKPAACLSTFFFLHAALSTQCVCVIKNSTVCLRFEECKVLEAGEDVRNGSLRSHCTRSCK